MPARILAAVFGVTCLLLFSAGADAAGPLTWSAAQNIDGAASIEAVDCPSPTLCVATDGNGNVMASADPAGGAATWTSTAVAPGVNLENVSCPSTTLCLISGYDGNVYWSTDPVGGTWSSVVVDATPIQLESLDCPSTTLCVAGGGSNGTVYWATNPTAGPWTPVHIDGTHGVFSLSCPTTGFCVTGNDAGPPDVHWTNNPTGVAGDWTQVVGADSGPNAGSVMEGMSCATASFCVGSDDFGNVVSSTKPAGLATDWTTTQLAAFPVFWNISCPTTTLCVTVTGSSTYTSTDPAGAAGTWATDNVFGFDQLAAVSCASAAFCVVGGSNGNVYVGTQATLSVTVAGAGNGSVAGNGIACPGACSGVFPLNTAVTLTATPAADGSTFAGWSGACTGTGACDLTMASDRAVIATFDPAPAPAAAPATGPAPTPAPAADQPLPPPTESKTANAYPTSGSVRVRPAGSKTFVPLTSPQQVQFGAIFDTRRGSVQIVIANGHGGYDSATFSQGQFKLVQRGGIAELDLFGGRTKGCGKPARGGAAQAARARKGRSIRHLWGQGTGSFRTKGRFASATIRGTRWLTDDRCFGTLVRVAQGAVTVRDLVKRSSRALRAPKSYFAARGGLGTRSRARGRRGASGGG